MNAGAQNPVASFSIRALIIGAPLGRDGGFCQSHRTSSRRRPSPPSRTMGASSVGVMLYEPCQDFHQSSGLPPSATNSRTNSSVLLVQRIIEERMFAGRWSNPAQRRSVSKGTGRAPGSARHHQRACRRPRPRATLMGLSASRAGCECTVCVAEQRVFLRRASACAYVGRAESDISPSARHGSSSTCMGRGEATSRLSVARRASGMTRSPWTGRI